MDGYIDRRSPMPHVAASCFIMIPTPRREDFKEETAFPARMGYACNSSGQASGNETECIDLVPVVLLVLLRSLNPQLGMSHIVPHHPWNHHTPCFPILSFPFLSSPSHLSAPWTPTPVQTPIMQCLLLPCRISVALRH